MVYTVRRQRVGARADGVHGGAAGDGGVRRARGRGAAGRGVSAGGAAEPARGIYYLL